MNVINTERVPIKIWSSVVEASAVEQLKNLANLPFIFKHVAAMPDVHWGMGATVGSVIATQGAVIPAAVGVDIGCGMTAWDTGLPAASLAHAAARLRQAIEAKVPVGFSVHAQELPESKNWVGWADFNPEWSVNEARARQQIGSLGGGNHFIEVCADERGIAWVLLHSGSRGLGKKMADVHMKAAKDQCAKHFVELPDPDLAYLVEGTKEFDAYMEAVTWCQGYAKANRGLMMALVRDAMVEDGHAHQEFAFDLIDCHHNYVTKEQHFGKPVWLTRKGAVCARPGMKGIIPGSMGAKSYIVEGLGNPESFHSCSHGAGRRMGRNVAKKTFTLEDLAAQTAGVDCRKDEGVLDEIPGAYKDIDVVMANQVDLVKPIHTLKQFLCIKG